MAELVVYEKNEAKVLSALRAGQVDYVDISDPGEADAFAAMLLKSGLLAELSAAYPSPRKKGAEVPVSVLVFGHILLRYHAERAYRNLPYVLRCGTVLNQFGLNAGWRDGFNQKNRKARRTPFDQDTMRKLFPDTPVPALVGWFNRACAGAMGRQGAFDDDGLFILDSSWVFLAENGRRENALHLRFGADDQPVSREAYERMAPEEKARTRWDYCHKIVTLLHANAAEDSFVFCGLEVLGKDNFTADVVAGRELVKGFLSAHGAGLMKVLVYDRGFLDGAWLADLKRQGIDSICPLKSNMVTLDEALRLLDAPEQLRNPGCPVDRTGTISWQEFQSAKDRRRDKGTKTDLAAVKNLHVWDSCDVPVHAVLIRDTDAKGNVRTGGLVTAMSFSHPGVIFEYYLQRPTVEERYRQLKNYWPLCDFTSTAYTLCVAQIVFIVLVYSLLQLHLHQRHLRELARATMKEVRWRERSGEHAVIVYWKHYGTVMHVETYGLEIARLKETARLAIIPRLEVIVERKEMNRRIYADTS